MNKFDNLMIDLETFGVCADAVVIEIGAVPFNFEGETGKELQIYPEVQEQINTRKVEWSTIKFWMSQEFEARNKQIQAHREFDLKNSLYKLSEFCKDNLVDNFKVWGNGFDIPLLNQAYSSFGLKTPWSYKRIMDCRTISWLSKVSVKKFEDGLDVKHSAVSDCKFQIRFVVDSYRILKFY